MTEEEFKDKVRQVSRKIGLEPDEDKISRALQRILSAHEDPKVLSKQGELRLREYHGLIMLCTIYAAGSTPGGKGIQMEDVHSMFNAALELPGVCGNSMEMELS